MKYAVSDIYGREDLLDAMLSKISLGAADDLYILGDVIDRGPYGIPILERCMAAGNFHLILGNHEEMLLRSTIGPDPGGTYRGIWLANGGNTTLAALDALPSGRRGALLDYVAGLPEWLDVDAGGTAYRLVRASWSDDRQIRLWESPSPFLSMRCTERHVAAGHQPTMLFYPDPGRYLRKRGSTMVMFRMPWFTGIDCGCGLPEHYKKRALGCLRLDDGAEFYIPA